MNVSIVINILMLLSLFYAALEDYKYMSITNDHFMVLFGLLSFFSLFILLSYNLLEIIVIVIIALISSYILKKFIHKTDRLLIIPFIIAGFPYSIVAVAISIIIIIVGTATQHLKIKFPYLPILFIASLIVILSSFF